MPDPNSDRTCQNQSNDLSESSPVEISGRTDPRLKQFLRQARAIIATERGVNTRSQLTLQSLAEQMQLPADLYQQAMTWLQQAEGAPLTLERYEKAFAEYLDAQLSELTVNILPVEVEEKVLAQAREKFQVSDVRALQILDHRSALFGISRVLIDEAEVYMKTVITEKLASRESIDETTRENLHKAAKSWGVPGETVDEIILECLQKNRAGSSSTGGFLRAVAMMLSGVAILFVVAWLLGWLSPAGPDPSGTLVRQPDLADSVTGLPAGVSTFDPTDPNGSGWPDWWPDPACDQITELATSNQSLGEPIAQLASDDIVSRRDGHRILISMLVAGEFKKLDLLESVFCQLYFCEPDDLLAAEWAARLELVLRPPQSGEPANHEQVLASFRANRLLARLLYWTQDDPGRESTFAERKSLLSASVRLAPGLDPEALDYEAYLKQSARILAVDTWNHLVQTAWTNPARSALRVQPLFELTKNYLESPVLHQFLRRTIESTLAADESRFRDLQDAISESILAADDVEIQEWIRTWFASGDPGFRKFLGRLLVEKCDLPGGPMDIERSLIQYRNEYQNRLLGPILARNLIAADKANAIFASVGNTHLEITPERIAAIVEASNAALAFVVSFESRGNDFTGFDSMTDLLPADLGLTGFEGEFQELGDGLPPGPTASDQRKKNDLLTKLQDSEPGEIKRMTALEQLTRVIPRFDDLGFEDADRLAGYFLQEMGIEEWLNVEKLLTKYKHLPTLKLALATRLQESEISLDQALTISTMLVDDARFIAGHKAWQDELAAFFLSAATAQLRELVSERPGPDRMAWNRLEPFLNQAYRRRLVMFGGSDAGSDVPGDRLAADLAALIARQIVRGMTSDRISGDIVTGGIPASSGDVTRPIELAGLTSDNELVRTVQINQIIVSVLAEKLTSDFPDRKWEIQQIVSRFELDCRTRQLVGQRLYLVEFAILKLLDLHREQTMEDRRNR